MFCPVIGVNNVAVFQKNTASKMNNISLIFPATGYSSICNLIDNLCPPDSICQSGNCVMQGTCYKNTITTTATVCSTINNTTWRIFKFTGQKWNVITTNDFKVPFLSRFDLVKDPSSGNLNFSASLSNKDDDLNIVSNLFTFDGSNWKKKNITYDTQSTNLNQAVSGLSFFNNGVGIYSVTLWDGGSFDNFMYIGPKDTTDFGNLDSTFKSSNTISTTSGAPFNAQKGCSTPQNLLTPDIISINNGDFHSTNNPGNSVNNFLAYVSKNEGADFDAGLCTVQVKPGLAGGTLSSKISVLVDSFTDGTNYLKSVQTQAIPTSAIQYWAGGDNGNENRWDLAILNVFQGPTIASGKDSLGQNIADFGSFAFVRFYATGNVGISNNTSSNSDDGAALFSLQLPKTGSGDVFEGYLLTPPKIQSNGSPETTISQSMKMAVHYDPTSVRFKVAILCPVSFDTREQQYRVIFWDSSLQTGFFKDSKNPSLGNIKNTG
jgi:hypothetical protein